MLARRGAYLPFVDGLRALSVASVVAYRAFPRTAHGGFIGVDIFFVISGYLITSHIAEELDAGRFSFATFYERRVRRIFPVLALVMASALAFGALVLDPAEYREMALQAASSAGFVSNVLFWWQAGYFDETAAYKPLQHLWSLAVEEQFYILWPLALAFLTARGAAGWKLAVAVAAASFALNLVLAAYDPAGDFYLLAARAWEVAIGASLALAPDLAPSGARGREALAFGGLALIVLGLKATYATQAFPGYIALLPTLGAALLIAAGSGAFVNRTVLSFAPVVHLGRISYSAYLWHWPLLAFTRILAGGEVGPPLRWGMIVATVALSLASYRWVERPFRFGAHPHRRALAACAAMAALGLISAFGYARGGLLWPDRSFVAATYRGDIGAEAYLARRDAFPPCHAPLFGQMPGREEGGLACRQSVAGAAPEVLLLGDSHADHLFVGLAEALHGRNVGEFARASLPLSDGPEFAALYRALAREPNVRVVAISAYWAMRTRGAVDFAARMRESVALLTQAGKTVYVLNDIPAFGIRPSRCKYSARLGLTQICEESLARLAPALKGYEPALRASVEGIANAHFVDTWRMLCDDSACRMTSGGLLLYRDWSHFNLDGSRWMAKRLIEATGRLAP